MVHTSAAALTYPNAYPPQTATTGVVTPYTAIRTTGAGAERGGPDQLQTDVELGTQLGIDRMPALFLNGRRVEHWRNPKTWAALLALDEPQAPPASQPQARS